MTHSDSLDQLATALASAQADIKGAAKTSQNPYFKSSYADLASVWEAIRGPLTSHGLSIVQAPVVENGLVGVVTMLLHSSGQWMRFTSQAEVKDLTAQSVGSAVTYLRRYAVSAMAGTYGDVIDDDGEAAQGRQKAQEKVIPEGYDEWLVQMKETASGGIDALQKAFKASPLNYRSHVTQHDANTWLSIKKVASDYDQSL